MASRSQVKASLLTSILSAYRKTTSSTRLVSIMLAIASGFVGFCCSFAIVWIVMTQPPVVITSLHELNSYTVANGQLSLVANKVTNQNCMTVVARFLYRDDPLVANGIEFQSLTGAPYAPPSVVTGKKLETIRVVIPIPPYVEPGRWNYYAQAVDTCNSVMAAPVRTSPPLTVDIVAGANSISVPADTLTIQGPSK